MDLLSQLWIHGPSSDSRGEGCMCAPRLAETMRVATCCPRSSQQHGSGAQEWRLGGRLWWLRSTRPWSHAPPRCSRAAGAQLCPQDAQMLNVVFSNEKTSCASTALRTVIQISRPWSPRCRAPLCGHCEVGPHPANSKGATSASPNAKCDGPAPTSRALP